MPWPMRLGPEPRITTGGAVAAADLVPRPRARPLPARVVVGRLGLELGGAGVDRLERALEPLLGVLAAGQRADLRQEPRVDAGARAELGLGDAAAQASKISS